MLKSILLLLTGTCLVFGQQVENLIECEQEADVVLILDRSGSVGDDYIHMVDFARFLGSALQLKDDGTGYRLGVVTYSPTATVDINLEPEGGFGLANYLAEIANGDLNGVRSNTNIADSLCKASELITDTSRGARNGVLKIVIFLNDGQSNVETNRIPDCKAKVESTGARIFSLGITTAVGPPSSPRADETKSIASDPIDIFYKWIPAYNELNNASFLEDFVIRFCNGTTSTNETTTKIQVPKCVGRKTPLGQLEAVGFVDPVFSSTDFDPPIHVHSDGSVSTSALGPFDALKQRNILIISVTVRERNDPEKSKIVFLRVQLENCTGNITRMPCETKPTEVEINACRDRPDKNIFLIKHPTNPRWFIFCNNVPIGICQRCASEQVFSEVCQHCIDKSDLENEMDVCTTSTPSTIKFCDLNPCPNLQSCSPVSLYPHPDSTKAFCQCNPGHAHGGCHLCPNGIPYFNFDKQCCQATPEE